MGQPSLDAPAIPTPVHTAPYCGAPAPHTPHPASCFAAGTNLLTREGWRPVETLRPGDMLVTAAGASSPLSQADWHEVNCRRQPAPLDDTPIRICAGAFGPDLPKCDVVLPPDQTVLVENVLIPARHLANGATVRRDPVAAIRYIRIALAAQDVLVADGLPVGADLANGRKQVGGSFLLLRTRAHLLARASALDFQLTQDPDLHLRADGARIWGRLVRDTWSGWVPYDTRELRIASRASAPADSHPESDDHRALGVALRGVTLHAATGPVTLTAASSGWGAGAYPPESDLHASWRWTDGNAELSPRLWRTADTLPATIAKSCPRQAIRVDLHLHRTHTYRLQNPSEGAPPAQEAAFALL